MMYKRTNEGGSILTFVIVGVVLAAIVGGGVYLVNQRNKENVAKQPTTSTNQPASNPSQPSSQPAAQNGTTNSQPNSSTNSSSNAAKPTATQPPKTGYDANAMPAQSGHLPTTGPADAALQLLGFSLLIGVSVAFVRSQLGKQASVSL